MQKKRFKFHLFPLYSDRLIFIAVLFLAIFGSFMIASAEMGAAAGDMAVIVMAVFRQLLFVGVGVAAMAFFTRKSVYVFNERIIVKFGFVIVVAALLATRLFGAVGGAYAWIRLDSFSIQPSEFAKVYIIVAFAKLLAKDNGEELNRRNFKTALIMAIILTGIIVVVQRDFGSGLVLFGIAYIMLLVPRKKEFVLYQHRMLIFFFVVIVLFVFLLSPLGTALLANFDGYQIGRFLSSADPFAYQYDSGYHLIMSLVSFATGGLFGLGYGRSIHKYMNFPNPSNDFILPVIVEELGLVFGFIPVVVLYGMILIPLVRYTFKSVNTRERMTFVGVFMYFVLHFVLNVGGVSGLIPLTGVPLLLLSSGGSSTVASMIAIGIAEAEIIRYRKRVYANNSR